MCIVLTGVTWNRLDGIGRERSSSLTRRCKIASYVSIGKTNSLVEYARNLAAAELGDETTCLDVGVEETFAIAA